MSSIAVADAWASAWRHERGDVCNRARYRWSIGHRPIPSLDVGELCKIDARELSAP